MLLNRVLSFLFTLDLPLFWKEGLNEGSMSHDPVLLFCQSTPPAGKALGCGHICFTLLRKVIARLGDITHMAGGTKCRDHITHAYIQGPQKRLVRGCEKFINFAWA